MAISSKQIFFATLLAAVVVAGCNTAPVMEVRNAPYGLTAASASTRLSLGATERAIIKAGANRGWIMQRIAPGHLEGQLLVRGHVAIVDILFNRDEFTISYKDSSNLKYDPGARTIHRRYNGWVQTLSEDIQREVQLAKVS